MSIGTMIKSIAKMLREFWSKIPQETKDKMIEEILKQLEKILRAYFKKFNEQQSSK